MEYTGFITFFGFFTDTSRTAVVPKTSSSLAVAGGSQVYTKSEKLVLEHTSHINSNIFVPFMNVDLHEKFVYTIPFTDKVNSLHIILNMSISYTRTFTGWILRISTKTKT